MDVLQKHLASSVNSNLITDFPLSFSIDLRVAASDIDDLGHMNNAVYVNWLDQSHLYHMFNLGITPLVMKTTQCAMVVRHSDLSYLSALRFNEIARVGTCVFACDRKLRLQRRFQMVRLEDRQTVLRGSIDYVCIGIKKGKPKRMPEGFSNAFAVFDQNNNKAE